MKNLNKDKFKVAFICHFSNKDVRKKLPLSSFWLKNLIKRTLGDENFAKYSDFAPWVTNLIIEFEKFEDLELHVISPHMGLTKGIFEFNENGGFYHFFKPDMPLFHSEWPAYWSRNGNPQFKRNRRRVKGFLEHIQPDIVTLIGTENPYYSITALDINDFPVFALAQTVYTNPARKKLSGTVDKNIWDIELQIHNKVKYYGC